MHFKTYITSIRLTSFSTVFFLTSCFQASSGWDLSIKTIGKKIPGIMHTVLTNGGAGLGGHVAVYKALEMLSRDYFKCCLRKKYGNQQFHVIGYCMFALGFFSAQAGYNSLAYLIHRFRDGGQEVNTIDISKHRLIISWLNRFVKNGGAPAVGFLITSLMVPTTTCLCAHESLDKKDHYGLCCISAVVLGMISQPLYNMGAYYVENMLCKASMHD